MLHQNYSRYLTLYNLSPIYGIPKKSKYIKKFGLAGWNTCCWSGTKQLLSEAESFGAGRRPQQLNANVFTAMKLPL